MLRPENMVTLSRQCCRVPSSECSCILKWCSDKTINVHYLKLFVSQKTSVFCINLLLQEKFEISRKRDFFRCVSSLENCKTVWALYVCTSRLQQRTSFEGHVFGLFLYLCSQYFKSQYVSGLDNIVQTRNSFYNNFCNLFLSNHDQ